MYIINDTNLQTLKSILILLTPKEAHELAGTLKSLDPVENEHAHVYDEEYGKEITVAVYTDDNVKNFHKDIQKIMLAE